MAIKPLVLVYQELRSPSANIINPTLSGCVIGPHYHVRTYEDHKDEIFADKYDVAAGLTILAMPAAVPGMKLKSDGFRLFLDNARVVVANGSSGAITFGGELTGDTGVDFTSAGSDVHPGDTVKITHVLTMAGAATGDGDGANPERITVTGIDNENVEVGDAVNVASGTYTGVVTAVEAGYVEVSPVIGTGVSFAAADIAITRTRIVRDVTIKQTYAVKEVVTDDPTVKNLVQMATNFPFEATGVTWEITRKIDGALLPETYYSLDTAAGSVELLPGAKVALGSGLADVVEYPIDPNSIGYDQADVYVEYAALDISYAHIPAKIELAGDLASKLGLTDYRNPLGLGATVMYGNGVATFYAIGLESEDLAGWTAALDAVNRGGYYAQALLTQDPAIIGIFKNNNVANEAPEVAQYGMVIGNHTLPLTVEPASGDAGAVLQDPGTGLFTIFEDTTADFTDTASPVYAGDLLTTGGESHVIDRVINANRLKVVVADAFSGTATGLAYTVSRELTKDQQAASIAATSQALKSKRCVMTWPDVCEISGREEPGYYLNCVVAGMIIGLPSQAGITNKGVAVVEKVKHTNWDYFTTSQLDTIAAGGTLVMVQDDPNSLPYVRHQLTTDPALIETAEISVVKNNDYLSLFFKRIVKAYLGEWNVTDELLGALRVAINQGIDFQKANRVAKIGAPLIDATIEKLEKSSISPDRVEIYIGTIQPKPLNTIGLHMIL